MNIFHLLSRVGYASGAFSTPYTQEEDDPRSEGRELRRGGLATSYVNKMYACLEVRRRVLWGSASLQIHNMRARASCVSANRE